MPSPTPMPPIITTVRAHPVLRFTPEPLPSPPPDVLKAAKFVYSEDLTKLKWGFLPNAPEERSVQFYVTKVRRLGPVLLCTGWDVRVTMNGNAIAENNVTFICPSHMQSLRTTPPIATPTAAPTPSA